MAFQPQIASGDELRFTATGAVTAGVPVVVGGLLAVPVYDGVSGDQINAKLTGVHQLAKKTGVAFAEGAACYWDATAVEITDVPSDGLLFGYAVNTGGKAAGDDTVWARLDQGLVGSDRAEIVATGVRAVAANSTIADEAAVTKGGTIKAITVKLRTVTASAGGDVTLAMAAAGNNLLVAATFDLESLSADTETALSLTAVSADLILASGDMVRMDVVSDNADATGGLDLVVQVYMR